MAVPNPIRQLPQWPPWHSQPLRLTLAEIADPYTVLADFFRYFDLPNLRSSLKQLLDDALSAGDTTAFDHVVAYDYLEKLAEAAWLLHEKRKAGGKKKTPSPTKR